MYALLARAAGELGGRVLFDEALKRFRGPLDDGDGHGMQFNAFTSREIQLRGLISTGRAEDAIRLMRGGSFDAPRVAPQWYVIERVTAAQVYLAAQRRYEAEDALRAALAAAEDRLPHQIQRVVRVAEAGGLAEVCADGRAGLQRIRALLPPLEWA